MSIVGQTASILPLWFVISFAVALVLSAVLGIRLHVYRPAAVLGPDRLPAGQPASLLLLPLGLGVFTLILAQSAMNGLPATALNQALLNAVPPLAFSVTILLADGAVGGFELIARLGINPRQFGGVPRKMLAAIIILPPAYAVSFLAEWVYMRMHVQHPAEHPLLKMMREAPSPTRWLLILTAVAIAPLSEELLFRGHLQTLLRRMFVALSSLGNRAGAPMTAPRKPPVWQTWAGILLTSCLFARAHDPWMRPPIFFLSLGLGYCYERTGNLWTSMTVHCIFNSISTFVFLTF